MLFRSAQVALGEEEAKVLMDMLTPAEIFDAWRADTQAGFAMLRAQMDRSETDLQRRIDETNRRIDTTHRRIDELETKMERQFDEVNRQFDEMNRKFDEVNRVLNAMEQRLTRRLTALIVGVGIPFIVTNLALVMAVLSKA